MMEEAVRFPLRLGFGCSGAWGMPWHDERAARAVLDAAYEAGVRCFDTAGFYGAGEAERRLGRALAAFSEPVFVSTKTGTRRQSPLAPVRKDFSEAAMRADLEGSLRRLQRDRVDLLYLHGPSRDALASAATLLERFKQEGKIAAWGVCGEGEGLSDAIDFRADAIMGVYNILRREHAATFARRRLAHRPRTAAQSERVDGRAPPAPGARGRRRGDAGGGGPRLRARQSGH
jgi:aryl-alcohol dehydrogenase-like predicted oxidoreductase